MMNAPARDVELVIAQRRSAAGDPLHISNPRRAVERDIVGTGVAVETSAAGGADGHATSIKRER
jgi:hypothetical protein